MTAAPTTISDSSLQLVQDEVLRFASYWHLRCALFTDSDEVVGLTQRFARDFFEHVYDMLGSSIILGLTKLTDRDGRTATFSQVLNELDNGTPGRLELDSVRQKIDDLRSILKSAGFNDHRNLQIAHKNRRLEPGAIAFDGAKCALKLAIEILNELERIAAGAVETDVWAHVDACSGTAIVGVLRRHEFWLDVHAREAEFDDDTLRLVVKRTMMPEHSDWPKFLSQRPSRPGVPNDSKATTRQGTAQ